jgi:hypothetical protein
MFDDVLSFAAQVGFGPEGLSKLGLGFDVRFGESPNHAASVIPAWACIVFLCLPCSRLHRTWSAASRGMRHLACCRLLTRVHFSLVVLQATRCA